MGGGPAARLLAVLLISFTFTAISATTTYPKLRDIIKDSVIAGQNYSFALGEPFTINFRTFEFDDVTTWDASPQMVGVKTLVPQVKPALDAYALALNSNPTSVTVQAQYRLGVLGVWKALLGANSNSEYRAVAAQATDVQNLELLYIDPENYKIRFARGSGTVTTWKRHATDVTLGVELTNIEVTQVKTWSLDYYKDQATRDDPTSNPVSTIQSGGVTRPCLLGESGQFANLTVTARTTSDPLHYSVNSPLPGFLPAPFAPYQVPMYMAHTRQLCSCALLKSTHKQQACCAGQATAT